MECYGQTSFFYGLNKDWVKGHVKQQHTNQQYILSVSQLQLLQFSQHRANILLM